MLRGVFSKPDPIKDGIMGVFSEEFYQDLIKNPDRLTKAHIESEIIFKELLKKTAGDSEAYYWLGEQSCTGVPDEKYAPRKRGDFLLNLCRVHQELRSYILQNKASLQTEGYLAEAMIVNIQNIHDKLTNGPTYLGRLGLDR